MKSVLYRTIGLLVILTGLSARADDLAALLTPEARAKCEAIWNRNPRAPRLISGIPDSTNLARFRHVPAGTMWMGTNVVGTDGNIIRHGIWDIAGALVNFNRAAGSSLQMSLGYGYDGIRRTAAKFPEAAGLGQTYDNSFDPRLANVSARYSLYDDLNWKAGSGMSAGGILCYSAEDAQPFYDSGAQSTYLIAYPKAYFVSYIPMSIINSNSGNVRGNLSLVEKNISSGPYDGPNFNPEIKAVTTNFKGNGNDSIYFDTFNFSTFPVTPYKFVARFSYEDVRDPNRSAPASARIWFLKNTSAGPVVVDFRNANLDFAKAPTRPVNGHEISKIHYLNYFTDIPAGADYARVEVYPTRLDVRGQTVRFRAEAFLLYQ